MTLEHDTIKHRSPATLEKIFMCLEKSKIQNTWQKAKLYQELTHPKERTFYQITVADELLYKEELCNLYR